MSKEGSPELTKSWVVVDSELTPSGENTGHETSKVQEVTEDHVDSDTDSISVISESGCSYKTDEEDKEDFTLTSFSHLEEAEDKPSFSQLEEAEVGKPETIESEPEIVTPDPPEPEESKGIEKLLYFATSAVCAVILIAFSVAIQQHLNNSSDVNKYDGEFVFPRVQNIETDDAPKKYIPKRKSHFKLNKLEDNDKHDKNARDNDPRLQGNLKSNFRLNKNKNALRCNKENCDSEDETYSRKIKELKIKEDYLKEKEKFLIEKEHDLMKKEIKLNKEKEHYEKNKHDKGKYRPNKEKQTKKHKVTNEQYKKRNISGHWYINLHEARDNMRQKRRASFKRNKAHWYFQWMVDRARLRVK